MIWLSLLFACGGGELALDAARYTLAWSTDGLVEEAQGWSVITDRGYEVHVREGSLTTYGLSLVACEDVLARGLSPIASAHAGHGEQADPSTWSAPYTQSLTAPEPELYGELVFASARYCQVHYLLYAAREDTEGAGEADVGSTLRLEAEVLAPVQRTLSLHVAPGHGALVDLPAIDGEGSVLELVARRDLAGMLDGIDLASATDEEIGWHALGRLADVSVQATLGTERP